MSYGYRYLNLREFQAYCASLGVRTSDDELECYEREGVMLPVARILLPKGYAKNMQRWSLFSLPFPAPEMPPALDRLAKPVVFGVGSSVRVEFDRSLRFDKEFGRNRYLSKPTVGDFKPWNTYKVTVRDRDGQEVRVDTAEHYYSYWQVHQLYHIQVFPDLYVNRLFMEALPPEFKREWGLPRVGDPVSYRTFRGDDRFFELLGCYIARYTMEYENTFLGVKERRTVKRLGCTGTSELNKRLVQIAGDTLREHGISEDECKEFLVRLVALRNRYLDAERQRLADELTKDAMKVGELLVLATGKSFDQISTEACGGCASFFARDVRHLQGTTRLRDHARSELVQHAAELVRICALPSDKPFSFIIGRAEVDELLWYCEREGLDFLPFALNELYTQQWRKHFPGWIMRHVALMNLAVSFEYLLRFLWPNPEKDRTHRLVCCVNKAMSDEPWLPAFKRRFERGEPKEGQLHEMLLENLRQRREGSLKAPCDYAADKFVITCAIRNHFVHAYVNRDWLLTDLFWEAAHAIICSILCVWGHAVRCRWHGEPSVKPVSRPDEFA